MSTYLKNILMFLSLLIAGGNAVFAQDSCNVQSYVRADGVLIRGVDFESIYKNDTIRISAAGLFIYCKGQVYDIFSFINTLRYVYHRMYCYR